MVLLRKTLYFLLALLVLASCGAKKKAAQATPEPEVIEVPAVPAWHTCVIQNARVTVNKDGSLVDVEVIRQVDPALDKEALRIVNLMPKWIPGKQCDKKVRVKCIIPIPFQL